MSTALRRALPLGAAILGVAALPGSALAAAGVIAPGGEVVYNTASVTLSNYPAGAVPITVTRDGTTIATGTANVGGTGIANLNVSGIAAPEPLDCWTGFTPDILPGDIVNIGASAVPVGGAGVAATALTMPNFSISRPSQVGGELVTHGTAVDALGNPMTAVTGSLISKLPRFSTGTKGASIINGALGFDNLGTGAFTTRFAGLTPGDMALGLSSATAEIATVPPGGPGAPAAVGAVFTIGADNPGVPGPVAGCTTPLGADSVTGASTKTVNVANQGQALTVTGSADPNVKGVTLTLGGSTVPATLAGGTWSATVNPANLPDGNLTAAATFTNAAGSYHGRTMGIVKDTVAPAAPTASVASGTYPAAQKVSLSAEPGSTIHYTTDGSDPTASSKSYGDAITVGQSQAIKAVAVDAAGNTGAISRFDYAINPPARVVPSFTTPAALPKLRLDGNAIDMARSFRLRGARKRGMPLTVFAPDGAKVVRVRLVRGTKTIDTVLSKVTGDGVVTVNLPHTRRLRRGLRRGAYQVLVTPGRSATSLGVTTVRAIKLR